MSSNTTKTAAVSKDDIVFSVDKCRWIMTEKGKLVRCKYTIPSSQMKKIMDWCESNIELLTDDEIQNKMEDIIKTFTPEMDLKEMKNFFHRCSDKINELYDSDAIIKSIYDEFGEVITTIELKKIYELIVKKSKV